MHRILPIACLTLVWAGGCKSGPEWLGGEPSTDSPHESASAQPQASPPEPDDKAPGGGKSTYQVHLSFDLIRADLPLGAIRHSKKIWNHVDEMRTAPKLVALMARNGLRVGVASPDDWTALRAILVACESRLFTDRLVPSVGLPLVIDLGAIESAESVFSYGSNDRLVGKTFPAGNKLLSIDYAVRAESGGSIDLEAGWEVRRDLGTMTWQREGGVIRQVPAYDRHVFADVAVGLTLNPGEMLVVGTSPAADNEYLVGSRFLSGKSDAGPHETVLFITPVTYQSRRDQKGVG